jgi:hypothetical protein
VHPFDLRFVAGFLLDLLNRRIALLFLAAGHDHAGPVEGKCSGDFISASLVLSFDAKGKRESKEVKQTLCPKHHR